MQKIATVYMLVNGAQTPFPLEEYYKMKATDKYIRKIRFLRIDDCLYEAPTDCFKAFHADAERKRREQARRKKAGKDGYRLIHYEALSSEGISGEERIEDPNCDVEETALLHLQICELRKALSNYLRRHMNSSRQFTSKTNPFGNMPRRRDLPHLPYYTGKY